MQEQFLLPLLAPESESRSSNHGRRKRSLQFGTIILRYITRRRLKVCLTFIALLIVLLILLLHKNSVNYEHQPIKGRARSRINELQGSRMKTVIGRYVGPKPLWMDLSNQNISNELLNSNNYDPDPSMGDDGRPVYLPGYPRDRMQVLFAINRFNLAASDKISVDRKLPEARKSSCRRIEYNLNELPNTSVIIVFHNEAWSTLVRTVHSILNTAPKRLLAEIILVDDASNRTFLGKSLDHYLNNLSSVRGVDISVIRSTTRIGLIKARLMGVERARGEVLTFIDAHCEATRGWLEPLLDQVRLDRKVAACPIIDIINEDTFAFTRSFELHLGAFNWGLNFRWYPISRRELVASNGYYKKDGKTKVTELIHPFKSPVMAGGLFSINRNYFNSIGGYDPEMDIWGGENIELSLRLWQCGGQVKIVPCSHVAHIFRKSSPYTFRPGREVSDILYSNLARVSEVWMDDWRLFFYAQNPIVKKTLHKVGRDTVLKNIEARKQLRKDLKCHSFEWFLDNVWPEHFFPKVDRFFGRLKQDNSGRCLQRPTVRIGSGQVAVGGVEMGNCSTKVSSQQLFIFDSKTGFLKTDENICLDSGSDPKPTRQVILAPCSESVRQKWFYKENQNFVHIESGLCLDSPDEHKAQLQDCGASDLPLKWTMMKEVWNSSDNIL